MRLLFAGIFIVLIASTGYCRSLSDINFNRLQEQAKERWGRDPFIKYEHRHKKTMNEKTIPEIKIKIDGIISDGKKALAIVNGNFFRKGDRIEDFLIKDISSERILLESKGKKYYFGIERFALEGGSK